MKKAYTVICSKNKEHRFPVVYEIEENTGDVISRPTERCPFCGALVEVTVKGKIENDTIIRRLGFEQ